MLDTNIKQLLVETLPDAQVEVQANGNSFMLRIVSQSFEGLKALKRQQLVYSCLNDLIKSGEMHAVSMRLFTPQEWEKQQQFSL